MDPPFFEKNVLKLFFMYIIILSSRVGTGHPTELVPSLIQSSWYRSSHRVGTTSYPVELVQPTGHPTELVPSLIQLSWDRSPTELVPSLIQLSWYAGSPTELVPSLVVRVGIKFVDRVGTMYRYPVPS